MYLDKKELRSFYDFAMTQMMEEPPMLGEDPATWGPSGGDPMFGGDESSWSPTTGADNWDGTDPTQQWVGGDEASWGPANGGNEAHMTKM